MISFLRTLINRIRALRHTRLEGDDALFVFHRNVRFILAEGSEIVVRGGGLRVGFPLLRTVPYASHSDSVIQLGKGARLVCEGTVAIAPGATIRVADGGVLRFEGENVVAHNLTLLCQREVTIGRETHISWNATLIDSDDHGVYGTDGHMRKLPYRPLQIGRRVGIQMNVLVPRGVTIGDLATISAGTVLRRDIPAGNLVYADSPLRIKEGILPGPPLEAPTQGVEAQ